MGLAGAFAAGGLLPVLVSLPAGMSEHLITRLRFRVKVFLGVSVMVVKLYLWSFDCSWRKKNCSIDLM